GDPKAQGALTDVYALGGLLYRGLAGRPPFSGKNAFEITQHVLETAPEPPSKRAPGTPPELERIALRCLEKDPGARFPSAQAVADALAAFEAEAREVPATRPSPRVPEETRETRAPATTAPPRPVPAPAPAPARGSSRGLLALVLVALVGAVAVAGWLALAAQKRSQAATLLARARREKAERRWRNVAETATQVLELDPRSTEALFLRAYVRGSH